MKIQVELDAYNLALVCDQKYTEEVKKHLRDLYQRIWSESMYDPYCEETEKYAKGLLPAIKALNDILKFQA